MEDVFYTPIIQMGHDKQEAMKDFFFTLEQFCMPYIEISTLL
jgi:hypothetical protein